ncbi:sentrin-specific protease 1 [Nasonia vitripennis]|uniref:Ubiquitin-like protease family profile domain-containing protein n=1 Tax=Nasonia vitripennis TaxID=7425 RepID=A0A7M7R4G4_NASVI|nr:sentrin-specific protease 1 [Nasonia vitripennis]
MIFEFLKRLFWKADEGNRKRKASETLIKINDDEILTKKCRRDFVSSNHVKINQTQLNSSNHSSLNSQELKIKMQNNKKLDSLEAVNLSLPPINISTFEIDNSMVQKESNQFTLYNTYRLSEKKQYSDMLLNFLPSERNNIDKEICSNVHQGNLNKKQFLEQQLFDNKYDKSSNFQSKIIYKSWAFHNSHKYLKSQSQKCVPLSDITHEQEYKKQNQECSKSQNSIIRSPPIEVIKTNTLRDKLSSKQVMKQNFISQITEKYDERIKQRYKEAEELKKLTYILSKHNQLSRETALEDHLNRSMRLCEAVLDEGLPEEVSKLPQLTLDMKERIKLALSSGATDEVLVEKFGLRITKKDIQTLAGLNWLNDEVINFYMNLIMTRSNNDKYPNVYAMNTFFYPKLISGGHSSLKRWTRKVDIFAKDIIVIPIHLGIHWCMSIIDFRKRSIQYFDSMGSPNYKCLQVLKQYLQEESIDKKKKHFDFLDWTFECIKDIPQQMNGSDCGVFSCMFAEYICSNKTINFTQDDMPYFRNKMVYEILTVQLL